MGFTLSTNFLNLCFMTLLRPRSPSDIEVVSTYCRNRPAIFSRVSSVQFVAVHTGVVITVVVILNSQKREIFCDHECQSYVVLIIDVQLIPKPLWIWLKQQPLNRAKIEWRIPVSYPV
ncbi:hypothetical protein T03_3766 [Trichinella britovi]|uniref:Uncharacterized protein n=1 Tax=Trichinella britovi TaxID=45882 RepID=A0A0V1AL44_TRIBR|nr:hypothetical protein T03_3766 [Trichinella britovi]